jgi:UDP-N-acetylglucosamine 2-epimerase (non-hydrolysing)
VDRAEVLGPLLDVLHEASRRLPLVFPVHPRTQAQIERFGLARRPDRGTGIRFLPPLGYLDFLSLTSQARLIVTDSGGLQEESTALGIPCVTCRANTERPITVQEGTSTLVGHDATRLRDCLSAVLDGRYKQGRCPTLWDGLAAVRIAEILARPAPP